MQAEDRLHRIGQKNAVHIINIEANRTIDQVIEDKLLLKRSWMKAIMGDS
jgi:SNF2 family DNA or RNA helicase